VSRSGYYEWLSNRKERLEKESAYKEKVKMIFNESGGTYGSDRICGIFRKEGAKASYHKVSRIMAELGLSSIHNRHRNRSLTDSRNARGSNYKNHVRGNIFTMPYQAVCSDISYLKTGEGFLYLCIVKDIVTGELLGQATSDNMRKELVVKAFLNAQARHPLCRGVIFHSDRGSQYTSKEFMSVLDSYGIKQSFSRVGMPGDNTWAESFFATFKKERIHFNHFGTRDEAAFATFAWIEGFYNNIRVQKRLGYVSPSNYRKSLLCQGKKAVA
jgi:putative transposase